MQEERRKKKERDEEKEEDGGRSEINFNIQSQLLVKIIKYQTQSYIKSHKHITIISWYTRKENSCNFNALEYAHMH